MLCCVCIVGDSPLVAFGDMLAAAGDVVVATDVTNSFRVLSICVVAVSLWVELQGEDMAVE